MYELRASDTKPHSDCSAIRILSSICHRGGFLRLISRSITNHSNVGHKSYTLTPCMRLSWNLFLTLSSKFQGQLAWRSPSVLFFPPVGDNISHALIRSIRHSETSIDFVQGPPGSRRERINNFLFSIALQPIALLGVVFLDLLYPDRVIFWLILFWLYQ